MNLAALKNSLWLRPGEAAIFRKCLEQGKDCRLCRLGSRGEVPSVVVEHGQVVAWAGADGFGESHDHNPAPISGRFQFAPRGAVIFAHGKSRWMQAGPDDEAFFAGGVDDAMNG